MSPCKKKQQSYIYSYRSVFSRRAHRDWHWVTRHDKWTRQFDVGNILLLWEERLDE